MVTDNSNRRPLSSGLGLVPCGSGKRRRLEASPVDKLVDDLLLEILVRLSNPRSVSRCKVVCKRWRLLLSGPVFIRRFVSEHWSRNQRPPLLLFSDDRQSNILSFLPMPSSTARMCFEVFDSHKDLVLCGFAGVDQSSSGELYRSYFLCNPFSKQWVALPLAPQAPVGWTVITARLVCQPRVSNNLDLGHDAVFVYSEYRFCVVSLYRDRDDTRDLTRSTRLHVFCSDSGEWRKEPLVIDDAMIQLTKNVVSCNGELFWVFRAASPLTENGLPSRIAVFNPFRPDVRPLSLYHPRVKGALGWDISFSQGALHIIIFRRIPQPDCPGRLASSIWRLEADRKSWREVCGGVVQLQWYNNSAFCVQPKLHPEKREVIIALNHTDARGVWTCNLETGGELEFFTELINDKLDWKMLHAEFSCWPTPIPRYEKLKFMYDGSYSCWVQSNAATMTTTTPSIADQSNPIEVSHVKRAQNSERTRIRRTRWSS